MNSSTVCADSPTPATPVLAGGLLSAAFGLVAFSPFGPLLASAFAEGWLAVYLDVQAFRLFCL
jgi:hypothetical protein